MYVWNVLYISKETRNHVVSKLCNLFFVLGNVNVYKTICSHSGLSSLTLCYRLQIIIHKCSKRNIVSIVQR